MKNVNLFFASVSFGAVILFNGFIHLSITNKDSMSPLLSFVWFRLEYELRRFFAYLCGFPASESAMVSLYVLALVIWNCWLSSIIFRWYSFKDCIWSIAPWVYAWIPVLINFRMFSSRLLLMASLLTVWGSRLTYNFWRRGGYSGAEDYRWKIVQKWPASSKRDRHYSTLRISRRKPSSKSTPVTFSRDSV